MSRPVHRSSVVDGESAVATQRAQAYQIISHDQLLAQFPGRSIVMIGPKDGHQEFVLLDR